MAAPTGFSKRKIAIILAGITIVSTAAVMGSAYLVHKTTGMIYDFAVLVAVLVYAGAGTLFTKYVVFRRIDRSHDARMREIRQLAATLNGYRAEMARLHSDAMRAKESDDRPAARALSIQYVATLAKYRNALPDDWPLAGEVDQMLADFWPDTADGPAPRNPEEIASYLGQQNAMLTQSESALDAVEGAALAMSAAAQQMSDATHDRDLSRLGGFDDPDKNAAAIAATLAFQRALDTTKFTIITKADEVASTNPQLAERLARVYVTLSRVTPGGGADE